MMVLRACGKDPLMSREMVEKESQYLSVEAGKAGMFRISAEVDAGLAGPSSPLYIHTPALLADFPNWLQSPRSSDGPLGCPTDPRPPIMCLCVSTTRKRLRHSLVIVSHTPVNSASNDVPFVSFPLCQRSVFIPAIVFFIPICWLLRTFIMTHSCPILPFYVLSSYLCHLVVRTWL